LWREPPVAEPEVSPQFYFTLWAIALVAIPVLVGLGYWCLR
jgi:hypothetical protein